MKTSANDQYLGWTFEQIAQDRNVSCWDVVFDLILEEEDSYGGIIITGDSFSEADIRLVLAHPLCSVESDTMALANEGVLNGIQLGMLGYNWVARYIAYYLRDEKVLSLEEGIRRITSLPASRIGLKGRGRLISDAAADILVFDLARIKDNSSFEDPTAYADGFEHVIVNGALAFSQGKRTSEHAGKVLRCH